MNSIKSIVRNESSMGNIKRAPLILLIDILFVPYTLWN